MRWALPLTVAFALLVGLEAPGVQATSSVSSKSAKSPAPCHAEVRSGVLPTWARSGFADKRPRIAHTLGRSGKIAAILFGYPLRSPPAEGRNNKILWVSRRPHSRAALWIRAQLMDGTDMIGAPIRTIVAGGPGPSLVNVPTPGCWRVTLWWSGRRDTLDLEYRAPN
jgi:hypothetical protein